MKVKIILDTTDMKDINVYNLIYAVRYTKDDFIIHIYHISYFKNLEKRIRFQKKYIRLCDFEIKDLYKFIYNN